MKAAWICIVRGLPGRLQRATASLLATPGSRRLVMTRSAVTMAMVFCLLFIASVQPFAFLYSAVHNEHALLKIATDLNHQRIDTAMDYFRSVPKRSEEELRRAALNASTLASSSASSSSTTSTPPRHKFTIVIITVRRKKPEKSNRDVGYVQQTAAALDSVVKTHDQFRDSFLFICNVDLHPQDHKDAAVLKDYLPFVERYGKSVLPFQAPNVSLPFWSVNSYDRERSDYTFCLMMASNFRSDHYIVFQDDAVPHPDFSAVLELSLSKLTKHQSCRTHFQQSSSSSKSSSGKQTSPISSLLPDPYEEAPCFSLRPPYTAHMQSQKARPISPSPDISFGYLKFFFPERWQGFAFEPLRILDLLSVSFVGGGLGLLLQAAYSCLVARRPLQSRSLTSFVLGIALSLVLAQLVGRQNLNELRRLSKFFYRLQESPDCCAPAVLYPAPVLPYLVEWLLESPADSKVDLRVSMLFHHHHIPMYNIEPNLVRHVGMVTSLKDKTYKKPVEEFLLFR